MDKSVNGRRASVPLKNQEEHDQRQKQVLKMQAGVSSECHTESHEVWV